MAVTAEGSMPQVNSLPHDPQPLPPAITTYPCKTPIYFKVILPSSSAFQMTAFQEVPPQQYYVPVQELSSLNFSSIIHPSYIYVKPTAPFLILLLYINR